VRTSRLSCAILLVLCATAAGDVVRLRSGARLVGRVIERGERVRIVVESGTLTFRASDVVAIEAEETAAQRYARRKAEVGQRDLEGQLELANLAFAAGLRAERGRILEDAYAWSKSETVRRLLDRWRIFERELPPDEKAEAKLAAVLGRDAKIHLTPHWRIAYDTDLASARRRGEMLEAAWRKFHSMAARTELEVVAPADRLEALLFREHDAWFRTAAMPEERTRGLVGIFQPSSGRILLYDAQTSPEARGTGGAVDAEMAALAKAQAEVDRQKALLAKLEAAVADGTAAKSRGAEQSEKLAEWVEEARASLARDEEALRERERGLARLREDLTKHWGEENVAATTHEACHQIAFAAGVSRAGQPMWLVEGLATLFEAQSRTNFVVEAPNEPRLADVRAAWNRGEGGKLPVLLTDALFRTPGREGLAYAESWALTYFLMNRHGPEFVRFLAKGALLPDSAESAAERLADFRRFFGDDLSALERDWRAYVERL
jgi:uncharacterized protein DUF1570